MDWCTHLLPVNVSTHPPPSFSLCPFSVCFLLEANCDWLIKTITAITKSNQVWAFTSHRYVDRLEYKLDGVGIRPNCCRVDKSKTLKLKARSIQALIWVVRQRLNEKIMVRKKQKKKPTSNINYLAALRTVREISVRYIFYIFLWFLCWSYNICMKPLLLFLYFHLPLYSIFILHL